MKTDQERREFYARLPKRHPNQWHWSHAARQQNARLAVKAISPIAYESVPASADSRIISADELYTFADSQGFSLLVSDEYFCLPIEESFEEQVSAQFRNMQRILKKDAFGNPKYVKEGFDCEDFADLMVSLMKCAHQNTTDMPEAGLAIGTYIYTAWSSLNLHAIVVGFIRGKNGLYMKHAEPQSGKVVKLYKQELESCMGVRI